MNPELRRNLWLELGVHRLVAMPLVLWLIFLASYLLAGRDFGALVAWAAVLVFFGLTALWGTRAAADSLFTEVAEHTWDLQRLSALSPWQMSWGKLLGATSFQWYGGLLCLAVFLAAAPAPAAVNVKLVAVYVAASIAIQALALAGSAFGVMRGLQERSALGTVLAALLIIWALGNAYSPLEELAAVSWYGYRLGVVDFALASGIAFAAWSLLGATRSMALALAARTLPWAWPAFALFLATWLAGFQFRLAVPLAGMLPGILDAAFVCALALTYLAAIVERKDPLILRRLQRYWQARSWRRFAQTLPISASSLALAVVLAPAVAASDPALVLPRPGEPAFPAFGAGAFAVLALALRDLGLLYFLALRPGARRPETTALLYFLLLYALVPHLLAALELEPLARLVLPNPLAMPLAAGLIAGVHVLVVAGLLIARWRSRTALA